MSASSQQTDMQQTEERRRRRDGRPDKTLMTNEERHAAGLMTRGQAAEHERLATVPQLRLAERVRGAVPDDPWIVPEAVDA